MNQPMSSEHSPARNTTWRWRGDSQRRTQYEDVHQAGQNLECPKGISLKTRKAMGAEGGERTPTRMNKLRVAGGKPRNRKGKGQVTKTLNDQKVKMDKGRLDAEKGGEENVNTATKNL